MKFNTAELYQAVTRGIAKLVAVVSPKSAVAYMRHHMILRSYDAASVNGPSSLWLPTNNTGDQEIARDWTQVKNRARDLDRNHPLVADALRIGHAFTVGNALMPQSLIADSKGRNKELIKQIEDRHAIWAEDCCIDGRDRTDYLRLVYYHLKREGESITIISSDDKHPFKLQPIEPEQVDSGVEGDLGNGNYAVRGIEFNRFGRAVAWHIFDSHPNGQIYSRKTVRIPASRVLHIYQPSRITETRGICHFVSAIMALYDQNELSDAILNLHRIAAAYGIFVETEFPEDKTYGLPTKAVTQGSTTVQQPYKYVESAGFHYMRPGEKVSSTKPEMPTGNFLQFDQGYLRKAARGMGMSYETFTGDLSNANFSTLKAGQNNERCLFRIDSDLIIRKICRPMWRMWMDAEHVISGLRLPDYWTRRAEYQKARFTLPALPSTDPEKEENADKTALENKTTSRARINERKGNDSEEVFDELSDEAVIISSKSLNEPPALPPGDAKKEEVNKWLI